MSIDMDIGGNTATSVGTIESCVEVTSGAVVTADITAEGIPPYVDNPPLGIIDPSDTGGIISFSLELSYAESSLTIEQADPNFLLGVNAGSALFNASEPTPDTNNDNRFNITTLDVGLGSLEDGSGVLSRLKIVVAPGAVSGTYPLVIDNAAHGDSGLDFWVPDSVSNASIAVNTSCGISPPSKTPSPTETPPPLAINDDFEAALEIYSLPFTHDFLVPDSIAEPGEPFACGKPSPTGSVWYSFTPLEDANLTLLSSDNTSVLAVYTGSSVGNLANLTCNALDHDSLPGLSLRVRSGVTIMVQFQAYSRSGARRILRAVSGAPPTMDLPPTPCKSELLARVGEPLTFTVRASDPDPADTVQIEIRLWPSSASFEIPPPTNPSAATFTWVPQAGDVDADLVFLARDNNGLSTAACDVTIRISAFPHDIRLSSVAGPASTGSGPRSYSATVKNLSPIAETVYAYFAIEYEAACGQPKFLRHKGSFTGFSTRSWDESGDGLRDWVAYTPIELGSGSSGQIRIDIVFPQCVAGFAPESFKLRVDAKHDQLDHGADPDQTNDWPIVRRIKLGP